MGFFKGIASMLLFAANFVIFVGAIVLITIGIIYKVNNPGLDIMSVSSYAIAVGVIIGLISFFGCYGACNGSGCMLTTYAVIMITIFIVQVVLGILAFIAVKNGDGELSDEVAKYLDKLYADYSTKTDQKDIVDNLQRYLECCGVNSTVQHGAWSVTCCKKDEEPCTSSNYFSQSCSSKLQDFIDDNAKIIGGVAIGFAVFELVAAGFACCVRKKNTGKYY